MRSLYVFSFFKMFLVIMPVFVLILQGFGLSMAQVMQAQAVFAMTVALCEVPTGYFADRVGRKMSMQIGAFLYVVCYAYLNFVKSFDGVLIYEVSIAVAMSLVNGADVALLYDHVHQKREQESNIKDHAIGQAFANLHFSQVFGESCAALLAGILAAYSMSWFGVDGMKSILVAQALVGLVSLACSFKIIEAKVEARPRVNHKEQFINLIRLLTVEDFFARNLLVALVTAGLSSFVAVWLLQNFWQSHQVALGWYGLLWASLNLTTGITGKFASAIKETIGFRGVLILIGALPVVGYISMGVFPTAIAMVACYGFYMSRGLTQVLLREQFNHHIPSALRATANSVQSFLFRGLFAIIGPIVGWGVDSYGLDKTVIMLGILFGVASLATLRSRLLVAS